MNKRQAVRSAGRVGCFFARHSLATAAIVLAFCVLWTIAYLALLLWAMIADGGIGSPVVYPIGLLLAVAGGTALAIMLFLPCTALAEWIAKRRELPVLFQIPISTGLLAMVCAGIIGTGAVADSHVTLQSIIVGYGVLFFALLFPLGLYWWTSKCGPLLLALFEHFRKTFPAHLPPVTILPPQ
ncbi:MAG: hypothetical protein V4819_16930 [Verrucomicrobiota bacterium]